MDEVIKNFKVRFVGVKPLIMHNPQTANPLNPLSKEIKKYTSKRTKTDEDHIKVSELEFKAACYFGDVCGNKTFYIPSENIEACIITGAKVTKKGKVIPLAVTVNEFKIPLKHRSSATTPEELFKDLDFQDCRFVTVNRSKILRTRPRFDQWELEFTVSLDTTLLDTEDFIEVLNNAGQRGALGDYRPKYGVFEVSVTELD